MRLLVYGSKEFSTTVAELVLHCGHEVVGMVDDYNSGPGIIGSLDDIIYSHSANEFGVVIAIGYSNLSARWNAYERIKVAGFRTPTLVHPRSYIADTARVGEGVMVMAGAIVDVRADIDDLSVLWPGACINHDSSIGKNTFVSPNATICGFVEVGSHCFIGAGSVIADHCKVPDERFIKMLTPYKEKSE